MEILQGGVELSDSCRRISPSILESVGLIPWSGNILMHGNH